MKVFIIGGTGLLGSVAAQVLIEEGHEVVSLALPPLPEGAILPKKMTIQYGNYLQMSDAQICELFKGCEGFIFAAGIDERVEGSAPIYEKFKKYNIDPLRRLLPLAKKSGVKHVSICGSYFAYFDRIYPEWKLAQTHPYIRSRVDQEQVAMSYADENFSVAMLELPYIFGTQAGRKPVWMFIAKQILDAKKDIYYPTGGSTMVTIRQVGEALAHALSNTQGGKCFPIGYYNLSWDEMLTIMKEALGCEKKQIKHLPRLFFQIGTRKMYKDQLKSGFQGGLYLPKLYQIQYGKLYIDKRLGCDLLDVKDDDIKVAITDSMRLCQEIIKGTSSSLDMKAE